MQRFNKLMVAPARGTVGYCLFIVLLMIGGLAVQTVTAQTLSDFLVAKGQVLNQTSAAAPTLLPTGGAVFDVEAPGFGGLAIVTGGTVSVPGGGSRTLTYDAANFIFQFTATADTIAGLDSTYPAGLYTITLNSAIIPGLTAGINLAADNFPIAPVVSNFDAAQAVNATNSFDLTYQPFTGAGTSDDAMLSVYDGSTVILSNVLSLAESSYTIPSGTLAVGKSYDARLRFRHLTVTKAGLVPSAAGFFSETRFPIKTQAGSTDKTPPTLLQVIPANGGALPATAAAVGFQFSKGMDHGRVAIQWAATLNGVPVSLAVTNFIYQWADSSTLGCVYAPLAGGWPAGLVVAWTLNPATNNSDNFADTAGNVLPVNTYSGSFVTYGGPWNCVAAVSNEVEAPGFYITKRLNYVQTSDAAAAVDSRMTAQFQAYYKDPASSIGAIVAVVVPIPGATNHLVKALAAVAGPAGGLQAHWFSESFGTTSAMDGIYPVGNYVLQLGTVNPTNPSSPYLVTNSATLSMATLGYPPIPHFTDFTVARSIAVTSDFTLTWDAFPGANTNLNFISLQVFDSSSNVVFAAPNSCAGISLPATATSVTIPANTLASNQVYTVALSFGTLLSGPEVMAGVPGQGFSALQRTTRLGLNGVLQLPPPPPVVAITSPVRGDYVTAGNVTFQVTASDTNAALSQLQLFNGANLLATVTLPASQSSFTGTLTGTFSAGPQTATVVATDATGQSATAGPVSFIAQDRAFVVNFSSPTNGAVYRAFSTIPLLVNAASPSGTITRVGFYVDGYWVGSANAQPFAWFESRVAPGPHHFYARAQDSARFSGISSTIDVTVAPPDLAPDDLTNKFLGFTISAGSAPFVASGGYKLFTATLGANYNILGNAGAGLSSGTYAYTKTGTNSGMVTLVDAQSGPGFSFQLTFNTTNTGSFALTKSTGGSQSGAFVLAPRLPIGTPGLFSLTDTNGPLQLYVSGQAGVIYAPESSKDLNVWSGLGKLTVTNLTTGLTDTNPPTKQRFYRARLDSTAFAPDSVAGQTFNFTIAGGAGAWPTNGIYQWIGNATNQSYQLIGGPGRTNRTGTWTYTRTGPDSGTIVSTDSQTAVQWSQQLMFTSVDTGFYHATNAGEATGFQSGSFKRADGTVEFLGNVRYASDTAHGASVFFTANGTPASISVTNADGYVWTLNLPADALLTPRLISMAPFTNIDSSASRLPMVSGVQLEPEGIQFNSGVTLTVTAPKPFGAHASLLMAGGDGSDLYFVRATNAANSYSTTLFHFSSGGATDPSDQQWQDFLNQNLPQIQAAYAQATRDVKALERPVVVPPEPPDYELTCDSNGDAAADQAIEAYEQALFAKESDAIRRMLGAARELALLGADPGDEPLLLAKELVETAGYRKVDSLFSHYSGNPKKFVAVTRVALGIDRQDELLGGSGRTDWLDEISSWANRVLKYYFDKLRNEHDYSLVKVVISVRRQIDLLGGGSSGDDQFFTDLANALTFKLTVDSSVTAPETTVEAKGDITINTDPNSFAMRGSGTMNYLSGSMSAAVLLGGQSFVQNVVITNFDACTNLTVGFVLDRFGADHEAWEVQGQAFTAEILTILGGGTFIVNGYIVQPPSPYTCKLCFSATLQNRQAEAVNQTFEAGAEGADGKLTLILLHTPK
jgi:hypothetical protein